MDTLLVSFVSLTKDSSLEGCVTKDLLSFSPFLEPTAVVSFGNSRSVLLDIPRFSDLSQPRTPISRFIGGGHDGPILWASRLVGDRVTLVLVLGVSSRLPQQSRVFFLPSD